MGKSATKWIKTVLFGKKHSKTSYSKVSNLSALLLRSDLFFSLSLKGSENQLC